MKPKNNITRTLLTIGVVISGVTFSNVNSQAATWHKGTPPFMRGHYYRTKLQPKYVKIAGKKSPFPGRRYEGVHVYKSTLTYSGYQYNANLTKCHYSYKGKYIIIRGKSEGEAVYPAIKVKRVGKNHIYANYGTLSANLKTISVPKLDKMTKIH